MTEHFLEHSRVKILQFPKTFLMSCSLTLTVSHSLSQTLLCFAKQKAVYLGPETQIGRMHLLC